LLLENAATFKYHKSMIPKYDPYLEKYLKEYQENPRSRVFAPLAEAYRKSGLIDEAMEICKEGLEYHPNFLSGIVALARCYFDKGLYTAAIKELEKVTSEVPDNYLAQKLLALSYSLVGDRNNALKAFKMVLYMNPRDKEAKISIIEIENEDKKILETGLKNVTTFENIEEEEVIPPLFSSQQTLQSNPDFKIIDDIVHEADLNFEEKHISQAFNSVTEENPDEILTNISTMTMGDLLVAQGHKEKALEVYKKILDQNPAQMIIKQKIEALEKDLGITTYDVNSLELDEIVEEETDAPEENTEVPRNERIEVTAQVEQSKPEDKEPLDDEWIFQNTTKDNSVSKLNSFLDKVKRYKTSSVF